METKKCSRCKEKKLIDEFQNCKAYKDGKQKYCKACRKKMYLKEKLDGKHIVIPKEKEVNPFAGYTLKAGLWEHFKALGVKLSVEQIEEVLQRLKMTKSFWVEIYKIESEFLANKK